MARAIQLLVKAGSHPRHACPVSVSVDAPEGTGTTAVTLTDMRTGSIIPVQYATEHGQTTLSWMVDHLNVGAETTYRAEFGGGPHEGGGFRGRGVEVRQTAEDRVEVRVAGALFTAHHFGRHFARPFCAPLNDAFGSSVTRGSADEKAGETTDHIHHRSLWTAYGEVNGTDNWGEAAGHGRTVHRSFETLMSGPVFGQLRARSDWTTVDGAVLLHEIRDLKVYDVGEHAPPVRLLDVTVELQAAEGDVHFGDTKEGGFLSVRVATSMDAVRGGKIENSYGAIGEAEAWGRRAHWCDYSGPLDGHQSGIAVMEHPDTFRSPTYWHVRDYGLMSTNPFGVGTFRNDPRQSGAYTLPAGERLRFAYRVYIHSGDATEACVADAYHGYMNPPKVMSL